MTHTDKDKYLSKLFHNLQVCLYPIELDIHFLSLSCPPLLNCVSLGCLGQKYVHLFNLKL